LPESEVDGLLKRCGKVQAKVKVKVKVRVEVELKGEVQAKVEVEDGVAGSEEAVLVRPVVHSSSNVIGKWPMPVGNQRRNRTLQNETISP
jgi:hypothetical protein